MAPISRVPSTFTHKVTERGSSNLLGAVQTVEEAALILSGRTTSIAASAVEGCQACAKPSFKSRQARASHFKSLHGGKQPEERKVSYHCPRCHATFSKSCGLTSHLMRVHGQDVGGGGARAGANQVEEGVNSQNDEDDGPGKAGPEEGGGGYAGDEPPPFGADGDEEDSSSSSSSSFLSSSRESDPSSSSGESPNDSSSSGNSDDSDSDSSSSSRSSFSSRSSTTSVQGAAAIESAVEEANSSEECVYEVDEAVFPDVSKAETRFAGRVDPPAFARLDALHEKRPNLMRAASLIHSLNLSRNQVKLLNKHVQCHVKEAILRASKLAKNCGTGSEAARVIRAAKLPKLMSAAAISSALLTATDRYQDEDKIRRTFHVSPDVIRRRAERKLGTEATVEFEFVDPVALMVELLTDHEFREDPKNYLWNFSPNERHNPTRRFGEINSGTHFRDAAHLSGADRPEAKYRLCPILLWTDKCSPDFKRQAQLKPMAVACGNLIGSICRKVSGKRLAGFWPKGLQFGKHPRKYEVAESHRFFNWVIEQLIETINLYKDGFQVMINGELLTLLPYIHLIATDWPEGQDLSGHLQGAICSKRNCRECLHLTARFNNTSLVAVRRTQAESTAAWSALANAEKSDKAGAKAELKRLSLRADASPFILARLFAGPGGFHEIFPMDALHVISGLVQVLRFFLEQFGDTQVVDERLALMPVVHDSAGRELHYRRFSNGTRGMSVFTHDDFVALLQQYPYVIGSKQLVIKNKEIESAMVKAFVSLRNICRVMKLRVVHDADRLELELEAEALGSLLTMLVGAIRKKNSATVDAFAAVVDASNGLQGDEIGQSAPKKRKKRGVTVVGDASKPPSVAGGAGAGRAVGGKRKRVADGVGQPAGAGAGRAVGGKRKRGAEGVGLPAASGAAKKRKLKHVNIPKVHALTHYSRNLRKFGCGLNFDTCHWELYHRDGVVKPFKTDARREEGMTGRLLAKNTRNVLIARYLAARAVADGEDDDGAPAAGVLPQRTRYARTRRSSIPIGSSDPKSPYTFSSLRRGNFDKVMSERVRSWGKKALKGGHAFWLAKLKYNILWQIKDRARRGIELDEEEVSGLQLAHFQVADVMDVSRDGATLRYVASNRYRKRAARFDFVEVDLANVNGVAYAAQLMHFICYKDKLQYAVVRYFRHFAKIEPNLGVYVCKEDDVDDRGSYGVVPVKSIFCHAHLIPDMDALEASADGSRWVVPTNCDYFWDKVQDGRISRSLSGVVERSGGGASVFSRRKVRRKERREALRRAAAARDDA